MEITDKIVVLAEILNPTDIILHGETFGTIGRCILRENNYNKLVTEEEVQMFINKSSKAILQITYGTGRDKREIWYQIKM